MGILRDSLMNAEDVEKPSLIRLWKTVCFDTNYNVIHWTKHKSQSDSDRQTCTSEADEKH